MKNKIPQTNRHHILYHAKEWSLRPYAKSMRETPSLIPNMDRLVHEELHMNCPPVPLLGYYALEKTRSNFNPTGNTLDDMDGLMSAMEKSTRWERFHPLERELAGLAIEAIELQRPWVKEGMR